MIVVSFVEGATLSKGGLGVVGVPPILKSLAERGHCAVIVMAGPPNPNCVKYLIRDANEIVARNNGQGAFGVVAVKAISAWAFAPVLLWRFRKLVRSADFISLHMLYSFPVLAGWLLARFYRKPYGVWPHGVLAPFQRTVSSKKKRLYDWLFARRILDDASVVFYSAEGERDEAADLKLKSSTAIIPHGIDVREFANLPQRGRFRARYMAAHRGPLVLFVARLNAKKGLDLLIDAMRLVVAERPKAMLAIAGPPDPIAFGDQLHDWVQASGIASNIVLTGRIGAETRLEALADADVFVLPSQAENFGFAIFEAMASRVPVVISDTMNYAGEIAAENAGVSVPREAERFAVAILDLIDRPEKRKEMGECGARLVRRYSWEENGLRLEQSIGEIVRSRGATAGRSSAHG